ncbi:MAG: UbiA prenyltransferase family protein [Candidatus Tectomicrobia bacterium]|nr:UbiA prenyltransferase family protein [Candidatus Tectomicrobia bacterium]
MHSSTFVSSTRTPLLTWKALLGLSRTVQASLSMAQPILGALVALLAVPTWRQVILGFIAVWAGNHAAFATNDLLDYQIDRRRFEQQRALRGFDIDATIVRHPIAQGYLSPRLALGWVLVLSAVTLVCATLLSPMAALTFVVAMLLEVTYCKLLTVTPWKFLITGVMVATGGTAGWFAVRSSIDWPVFLAFFVWMGAWEIGGRNIVNDWSDVEEDRRLGIRTMPVVYGFKVSAALIVFFLVLTFASSLALASVLVLHRSFLIAAVVIGAYALLLPGLRLLRDPQPERALELFNRASFYPAAMLAALLGVLYLPALFSAP